MKRKEATEKAVYWLDKILPGGGNGDIIKKQLDNLTDEEFEKYMLSLKNGDHILPLISPNFSKNKITIENNFKVAEELGHDFFQHLILTDSVTGFKYKTPVKYLVMLIFARRQQQHQITKASIPKNNARVDELSGQPTGDSKGSKISFPEAQVLYAQEFNNSLIEFLKTRGGDNHSFKNLNRSLIDTGSASLEEVNSGNTRTKSVVTLATLFKAIHIDNTLL